MAFPLSALCGQEKTKFALCLLAVNPRLKGVLLAGEKGTGKSTAARALANLLKEPFLNLPLSVTEESLLGTLDLKAAVSGRRRLKTGLLARADGGVVYIDEINLFPRPLLTLLLDVLETGVLLVEREGVSCRVPARFVLIGSMNPEEGPLPPQLLDRFGLCVQVEAEKDLTLRVEVIKRRLAYERDPKGFAKRFVKAEEALKTQILSARKRLTTIKTPEKILGLIGVLVEEEGVSSHRAELMLLEAAKASAALAGREEVALEDVERVKELVLWHRRRPKQEEKKATPKKEKEKQTQKAPNTKAPLRTPKGNTEPDQGEKTPSQGISPSPTGLAPSEEKEEPKYFPVGEVFKTCDLPASPSKRALRLGRHSRTTSLTGPGHYLRPVPYRGQGQIALLPTLLSAALQGKFEKGRPQIGPEDLKAKLKVTKTSRLLLFCVDGSGSMAAEARMKETKGAIMSLLLSAYQRRDLAAMMVFRGKEAELVLPPTASVEFAGRLLAGLKVGGSTPLSHALLKLGEFLARRLKFYPQEAITVILITDGRGNVSFSGRPPREEIEEFAKRLRFEFPRVQFVIVDTETGPVRLELAKELAKALEAHYFTPEALRAERLFDIAKEVS